MEPIEPQHADVLGTLGELLEEGLFPDFTLHLKEGPVEFSRMLMSAMSPFFRKLVTVDMVESRSREVHLEHVSQDTWTCITRFYFSSSKLVTGDNVQEVLEASHAYGLERLLQYCGEFLERHLSPENCLTVRMIASQFELKHVLRRASRIFGTNFSTLCKSEDFLSLEKAELLELLDEKVLVTTEDDLCRALLAWMENNDADEDSCAQLFEYISLIDLSGDCIQMVVRDYEKFTSHRDVEYALSMDIKRRQLCIPLSDLGSSLPKRRSPRATSRLLVLGHNFDREFCMYVWSFLRMEWVSFPVPSWPVGYGSASADLDDTVVVTGGGNSRNTHLFDLDTSTWTLGPDLNQKRRDHGMAVVGSKAYVVAGFAGECLSSIEEYSHASGEWTLAGNLLVPTDECGVAVLGDLIVVAGGGSEERDTLIQTFDVGTGMAAVLEARLPRPMHHVRGGSLRDGVCFMGWEGDLVQLGEKEGELQVLSHEKLAGFESEKARFGLQVAEDCVRVIREYSAFVECWRLSGRRKLDEVMDELPEEVAVGGMLGVYILKL